jgi:DNA-binding response OmpR family regulator/nitrogen-specific signal transduction histidine kinase
MNGNILIVDDNPDNLSVLEGILASDGYEVRPAVCGKIALKAAVARPPDLILLDIMMPGMDGFDVCRRLKSEPSTAEIPVLFISALDETGDKLRAFDAGGLDYITKPFAEQEVLARVRTHLRLAATQRELQLVNMDLYREIEARKESERNLVEAQRIAHVGNWTFDICSANVLSASAEWYRIFGVHPEKFSGTREAFLDALHPEDRHGIDSVLGDFFNDFTPFSIECRVMLSDGQERIIHLQAEAAFDSLGNPLRGNGTAQDITEQRLTENSRLELERKLLRTQKQESLGTIAGGIAHNFNNLLAGILGYLDLGISDMSEDSPSRGYIEQAMLACERAANLTRQMLAYSGKGLFMPKPVDINEVVLGNADLLRSTVSRNVTLGITTAPDLPLIEADEGQIQQVVMNLLINASEAVNSRPGKISLSTGVQECDDRYLSRSRLEELPPSGRFVYIEVSDTGCGMEEETRRRLFEPFFTTKFMGRGLGMSAVLGIVQLHNGAIVLESEPGTGSEFRVLFPVSGEADNRPQEIKAPADGTEGPAAFTGAVLVVDDEEQVREMCMAVVNHLGFRAIGVTDGEEAVKVFNEHADDITLVILDLTITKMDGISTFNELKRIRSDVRVILSSGYCEQIASGRFHADRPDGFVQKPYYVRDLQNKITQVMKSAP